MATLVRIIAKAAVDYSHDNGLTRERYVPGQLYEVPDAAARGMVKRGWAQIEDRASAEAALSPSDAERQRIEEEAAANQATAEDGESTDDTVADEEAPTRRRRR